VHVITTTTLPEKKLRLERDEILDKTMGNVSSSCCKTGKGSNRAGNDARNNASNDAGKDARNNASNNVSNGVDLFVQLRRFAQRGDVENVRALLPKVFPNEFQNSCGGCAKFIDAFRLAIWNGWPSVAELLVQFAPWLRGYPMGRRGWFALDDAGWVPCESDAFAKWLINKERAGWPSSRPRRMASIQLAARQGRFGAVKRLINAKANVQGDIVCAPCESDAFATWLINKERAGWPAYRPRPVASLQLAARQGRVGAVKRLIHAKANVEGDSDRTGWRPIPALYCAVYGSYIGQWWVGTEQKRIAAIAVLLRAKATLRRPETVSALGALAVLQMDTPLGHAVSSGQLHMTRYLLRCKADANEECFGDSPLKLATKQGNQAMEALLRCAGAQEAED
jgi:hypothetical protein